MELIEPKLSPLLHNSEVTQETCAENRNLLLKTSIILKSSGLPK
jgi:hypothetical protein